MRPTTSPWSDKHCARPHATREATRCNATAPGPRVAIAVAVVCALAACSNAESPLAPAAPVTPVASTPQVSPVASAAARPPEAVAAATAQGSADAGRDPFAGVDPTQNDVLRNIARLDPGAAAKAAPRPPVPRSVDAAAAAAPTGDTAPPGDTPPVAAPAAPVAAPVGTAASAPTDTTASIPTAATDAPERAVAATVPGPSIASGAASAPTTASPTAAATVPVAATTAVTTRRAIAQPSPSFPRDALREGINEGRVVANLAVAADGRVTEVTVISTTPSRAFGRVAQQALRDWRYEAAAAPSSVQVELVFRSE